jgi:hypothetical protein
MRAECGGHLHQLIFLDELDGLLKVKDPGRDELQALLVSKSNKTLGIGISEG